MKTCIRYLLILIFTCNLHAKNNHSLQDTLFEVFPLRSHLHYTYDYYSEIRSIEVAMTTELIIDSGTIEYLVHDSTVANDTTILWNVEERKSIWHNDSTPLYIRKDTAYWTYDTTLFSLNETTTGFHQLISRSFLWQFPELFPLDSNTIFRFSNISIDTIGKQWYLNNPCTSGYDTLLFFNKRGLVQRVSSSFSGSCHNTHTAIYTNIKMRGNPILSVIESNNYPIKFSLDQNYPNPFNPNTTIQYILAKSSFVTLRVYDLLGREIKTLDEGLRFIGRHSISFRADNLTSGIYFYRLYVGGSVETKKLVIIK